METENTGKTAVQTESRPQPSDRPSASRGRPNRPKEYPPIFCGDAHCGCSSKDQDPERQVRTGYLVVVGDGVKVIGTCPKHVTEESKPLREAFRARWEFLHARRPAATEQKGERQEKPTREAWEYTAADEVVNGTFVAKAEGQRQVEGKVEQVKVCSLESCYREAGGGLVVEDIKNPDPKPICPRHFRGAVALVQIAAYQRRYGRSESAEAERVQALGGRRIWAFRDLARMQEYLSHGERPAGGERRPPTAEVRQGERKREERGASRAPDSRHPVRAGKQQVGTPPIRLEPVVPRKLDETDKIRRRQAREFLIALVVQFCHDARDQQDTILRISESDRLGEREWDNLGASFYRFRERVPQDALAWLAEAKAVVREDRLVALEARKEYVPPQRATAAERKLAQQAAARTAIAEKKSLSTNTGPGLDSKEARRDLRTRLAAALVKGNPETERRVYDILAHNAEISDDRWEEFVVTALAVRALSIPAEEPEEEIVDLPDSEEELETLVLKEFAERLAKPSGELISKELKEFAEQLAELSRFRSEQRKRTAGHDLAAGEVQARTRSGDPVRVGPPKTAKKQDEDKSKKGRKGGRKGGKK